MLIAFQMKKPPAANNARIKQTRRKMRIKPTIENLDRRGGGVWVGGTGKGGGAAVLPPVEVEPIFPARLEIGAMG